MGGAIRLQAAALRYRLQSRPAWEETKATQESIERLKSLMAARMSQASR